MAVLRLLSVRCALLLLLAVLVPAHAPRATITAEAAGGCPCSFFSDADVPGTTDDPDGEARQSGIEVGVRFTIDTGGYVSAIRYYRGAGNTGFHLGTLWRDTGAKLASGWFRNESAAGWQTMTFRSPIAVAAGTYVASYHTDVGSYSSDEASSPRRATPGACTPSRACTPTAPRSSPPTASTAATTGSTWSSTPSWCRP